MSSIAGRTVAKLRKAVIAQHGNRCWYCLKPAGSIRLDGKGLERMTLDHVVPKSKGGKMVIENLVPCCHACNTAKADKDADLFKASRLAAQPPPVRDNQGEKS